MAEYTQTKFDSKSFNPVAFGKYVDRIPTTKKNELIKSRALRGNPTIEYDMENAADWAAINIGKDKG